MSATGKERLHEPHFDRRHRRRTRQTQALAALKGQSIKEFVLSRTIGDVELPPHLAELEAMLEERIRSARATGTSDRTVGNIFERARRDAGSDEDA